MHSINTCHYFDLNTALFSSVAYSHCFHCSFSSIPCSHCLQLSFRPTVTELKQRNVIKFNDYVEVTEVDLVDRKADKPWLRLTPRDKVK